VHGSGQGAGLVRSVRSVFASSIDFPPTHHHPPHLSPSRPGLGLTQSIGHHGLPIESVNGDDGEQRGGGGGGLLFFSLCLHGNHVVVVVVVVVVCFLRSYGAKVLVLQQHKECTLRTQTHQTAYL